MIAWPNQAGSVSETVQQPRFSVVIPTRNRPDWLKTAIESVVNQSFKDFELVVVDNSSFGDESTKALVELYLEGSIHYIRTGNLTMAENWQAALEAASGEYVIICTDKMLLTPNLLAIVDEELRKKPSDAAVWKIGHHSQWSEKRPSHVSCQSIHGQEVWDTALSGSWRLLHNAGPRGMNSAVSKSIIQKTIQTLGLPICRPNNPDYTIALSLAAVNASILAMDYIGSTFLADAHGNGMFALMAPNDDLVKSQFPGCYVTDLPLPFNTGVNLIYQDIISLNKILPAEKKKSLNWEMYYIQQIHEAVNADELGGFSPLRKKQLLQTLGSQNLKFRLSIFKTIFQQEFSNLKNGKRAFAFQLNRMRHLLTYAFRGIFPPY